jgi:hypothetical protein
MKIFDRYIFFFSRIQKMFKKIVFLEEESEKNIMKIENNNFYIENSTEIKNKIIQNLKILEKEVLNMDLFLEETDEEDMEEVKNNIKFHQEKIKM